MAKEAQSAVIVGGGVIGLACAYHLANAGLRVTVVERDPSLLSSCSEGNAGLVVPSHFVPLAAPGVISQGLKWMLDRSSPFCLRPRADLSLMRWLWLFYRHANADHVKRSEGLLRDLGLESRRLHQELSKAYGYGLVQRGLMVLCQSEEGLAEEAEVAKEAERLGLKAEVFGRDRLKEFEPGSSVEARGGVWFTQDCHLAPMNFISALREGIASKGGEFIEEEVDDFIFEEGKACGVRTSEGSELSADEVVLAGGVVTSDLVQKLGLKLPIQGGKGYSLTLRNPRKSLKMSSLLKESRVAVTPMDDRLRIAGTMEICGTNTSVSRARLQGIIDSFCRFYPDFKPDDFSDIEPWVGLRPCSPDGLPYLGRLTKQPHVIIAGGHSMLGLSLAPVTGLLCRKIVCGEASSIDLNPLSPERFH